MTDIPATKYIRINEKGVFCVGGPTCHHNGYKILNIDKAKKDFANIKKICPQLEELHIGTFETKGEYAKPGNPSEKNGQNSWCRAKFCNGDTGNWVCVADLLSDFICSRYFVQDCIESMCLDSVLQSAVLVHKNKEYTAIKVIELGNYRFTIEKIIQKTR